MKPRSYYGFFNPHERYGDNEELFKRCVEDPSVRGSVGISLEEAVNKLELSRKFPSNEMHSRLVAHNVRVYEIKNPVWARRGKGKLVAPQGELTLLKEYDMAELIKDLCEEDASTGEIVEYGAVHKLEDGTEIRGTRVRVSPRKGPPSARVKHNSYLSIDYDSSRYAERGYSYTFNIRKNRITPESPLEYYIETYVQIDGEEVSSSAERLIPLFEPDVEGKGYKLKRLEVKSVTSSAD